MVNTYTESTGGKLELHFLPGYAPELNPDEFVWSNLRSKGTSKKPLKKNESLRKRVDQDLVTIKKDKALVRSFFCCIFRARPLRESGEARPVKTV